jgi:hypothetical protein
MNLLAPPGLEPMLEAGPGGVGIECPLGCQSAMMPTGEEVR